MADRRRIWISFGPVGPESYLDHATTAALAAERVAEFVDPPVEWMKWIPSEKGRTGLEIYPRYVGPNHIRIWHGDPLGEGRPDAELGPREKASFKEHFEYMIDLYSRTNPVWRRVFELPGELPEWI